MRRPLVLISSVQLEVEPLLARGSDWQPLAIRGKEAWDGRLNGRPILLVAGGMGKTNAAHALTAVLERGEAPLGVIGFGVGGAYPGGGGDVGGIALATREIYGDEGVGAPGGWMGTDGIGIPLVARPGHDPVYNEIPLDQERVERSRSSLRRSGLEPLAGPFVTVSCCSGTAEAGRRLQERFGAVCETMEGAAYAHVAALYGTPFVEVRGISNLVEDRDLARWRLREAAEAAAGAAAAVAGSWED